MIIKTDLALYLGASLVQMERDTCPFVSCNLMIGEGLNRTIAQIKNQGMPGL